VDVRNCYLSTEDLSWWLDEIMEEGEDVRGVTCVEFGCPDVWSPRNDWRGMTMCS